MNAQLPLPDGWQRRRLRFDVQTNPLKSRLSVADDLEVSFVPMDAVGEYGGLRLDETKPIADVYNGYTYFGDGDVCIAKITPCFENGKGALASGLLNGVAFGTTELHVLRPLATIDKRFLFYISISNDFRSYGGAEMLGAGGQKRVPEDFLKDWPAALPPLDVQQRIAGFLDQKTAQIDALIAKKRALLDRLAEKRQSLITRAVTKGLNPDLPMKSSGIDWLGDIPAHWGVVPFKWRCNVQSGQVDPTDPHYAAMPLVAPDHIEAKTGRLLDVTSAEDQAAISGKYYAHAGTVLYSKIRPALRKVALFEGDCLCSADMYAIDPGEFIDRHFLYFFLLTDSFSSFAELESLRVAMPKVNRDAIGAFRLPIPPLEEQMSILKFLSDAEERHWTMINNVSLSVTRLEEYRSAMITAAVTGKLRNLQ